jgi:SAM-dependent methyltransferase
MEDRDIRKVYFTLPPAEPHTQMQKVQRALLGGFLSPVYWQLAHRYDMPGLQIHRWCSQLGLRLLCQRRSTIPLNQLFFLMFGPLDSTRYFEFDFAFRALATAPMHRLLDVSSPRFLPLLLLTRKTDFEADLINPDAQDLAETTNFVRALGLEDRCHMHECLIESVPFQPESYDVITSISVVEHIRDAKSAIEKMWELLKPGGKLILSLPCAAESVEQYVNVNHYGVLAPDERGFTYLQHLYDERLLQERIFSITGKPVHSEIWGEKSPGFLRQNLDAKWADRRYPYWREPYMLGREFTYFEKLADLPGEGVIAMESRKQ